MIPFIFGSPAETTIPQLDSLHLVADLSQLLFLISLLFLDSLPQEFTDELSTSVCDRKLQTAYEHLQISVDVSVE